MRDPLLSIIIPLFNTEKYIASCLNSIINSGINTDKYEILIINDGSTDNGPHIAKKYEQTHDCIRVISQTNQGLSAARNTGIENAKGEYIWFIDSDDKIANCIDVIISDIKRHKKPDLYGIILNEVDSEGKHIRYQCDQQTLPHNIIISGRNAIIGGYNPSSACALLMRKEFIDSHKLRFKNDITHEDVDFTYRAMALANRVLFSEHIVYYYYRWGNTMSTAEDSKRLLKYITDDIAIIKSFRELANNFNEIDPELYYAINNRSNNVLFSLVYSLHKNRTQWKKKGIQKYIISQLKEANLYPMKVKFDNWKKKVIAPLLNQEWFIN